MWNDLVAKVRGQFLFAVAGIKVTLQFLKTNTVRYVNMLMIIRVITSN